ncbi:MAG TPA: LamG-like jellyroll fold domain-containing protein [Candidatus Saccharimonadales bacterium]|nr:LamG-like jellyroll fold domain-containing protein [Candidatus Saccharimonadales bacterium]
MFTRLHRWRLLHRTNMVISSLALVISVIVPVLTAPLKAHATVTLSPLHVSTDNSRYFADSNNNPVFLFGDHTWQNFIDSGNGNPPSAFNYSDYLSYINARGANWFRLWDWEQTRWSNETSDNSYWFGQSAYNRVTGHGTANDGGNKFDLTSFNQDYFDRMRSRVIQAGEDGDYVSVMLFNGWSTECKGTGGSCGSYNQPFVGHPYNSANNINSINGDPNNDGQGYEVHEYDSGDANSVAIVGMEDAYVQKVVDTVGDLPNVMYEICNECNGSSLDRAWQNHMVDLVHSYSYSEFSTTPMVGFTLEWPNGSLFAMDTSNADWTSFGGSISNPPLNDGTKVVIQDTDHVCGTCTDNEWPWLATTRGQNISLMDTYDGAGYGNGAYSQGDVRSDSSWENMRHNMGQVRTWMGMLDLKHAVPSDTQSSTGYALVNDGTAHDDQYLVFSKSGSSSFTVDLSNTAGNVIPTWYDVTTEAITTGSPVAGGSSSQSFTKPSSSTHGYALLLLEEDTTNPTVSVTAPSASATVSGSSVTLSASASDNRGIAGVQFKVDGTNVGSEDTTAPYSVTWDSTGVGNGSHTITAVARDTNSNTTTSSGVSVTVSNSAPSGLVAAWGFNNSSTPMADSSGNGYSLTCTSTCATYTSSGGHGTSSGAYDFSGTNDGLQTSVESPFDFTTAMTVEFWFKTPSPSYDWGATWGTWVAKGDSAWSLGRYGGYDSVDYSTYNGSSWHDARSSTYNTDTLNDGSWHHFAATYDGTYKKVYVDGSLVNTYSYSATLNNNSYDVSLGLNLEDGLQYNGMLDDVRIYNRALTSTEVGTDMNTPVN